jgi:hypothetical protein
LGGAKWRGAAQGLPALVQVMQLPAILRRFVERQLVQFIVGNRDAEARAEFGQLVFVQLLGLVGDVTAFAGLAQAITFDGLGQDDCRAAGMVDRLMIGGEDFFRVVAAAR